MNFLTEKHLNILNSRMIMIHIVLTYFVNLFGGVNPFY